MEHLKIKINPEVFKLKDAKVQQLLSAKMPLEMFAMTIRPEDPYVLIGDTIYAYTEQEFYALRGVHSTTVLSDMEFKYVLGLEDTSFMSDEDARTLAGIRDNAGKCSSCTYRRYKDKVFDFVKRYNIEIPEEISSQPKSMPGEYPETTEKIAPLVFALVDHMYSVPLAERKACMDCVEKHLSQAYVLSCECVQGYPEHISYVIGHLGEALDEMPKELHMLKQTVEFCLARTNYTGKPFVPLGALISHINMARMAKNDENEAEKPDAMADFDLEVTEDMKNELKMLPESLSERIFALCRAIDDEITLEVQNLNRNVWLGHMACLSDEISQIAPKTANMIRSRRLVFSGSPDLMIESGYPMADIAKCVRFRRK